MDPDRRRHAFTTWSRAVTEHPENFLDTDADSANLQRPAPRTLEELAAAPDPLDIARANRRSSRQALAYFLSIPLATIALAFLLAVLARVMGGPYCDTGQATWLCSPASRVWWPIATSIVPGLGLVVCGFIVNHKLKSYTRWRPWMGVFWFLVPWFMGWVIMTGQYVVLELSTP